MNIYDKLLTELQNQKVNFFGNLVFPNHFRITLEQGSENLFLAMYIIKNHNFSFFTISTTSLSNLIEFFFFYPISGRNFLFSVVYDLKSSKNYNLNSISSLFPEAKATESIIESISTIKFQNTSKNRN